MFSISNTLLSALQHNLDNFSVNTISFPHMSFNYPEAHRQKWESTLYIGPFLQREGSENNNCSKHLG